MQARGLLRSLESALADERVAVHTRDLALLERCTRNKQALVQEIESLADAAGGATTLLHDPEVRSLAGVCRTANESNGVLVGSMRRATERALAVLTGQAPEGHVYDTSGRYAGSA